MKKRLLALLLCTCMVVSFLPGLIVAEGETGQVWLRQLKRDKDIVTGEDNYMSSLKLNYSNSWNVWFYYGTEGNYGEALDLKEEGGWTYTPAAGAENTTVTVEKRTDSNGQGYYVISADYPGSGDHTGTLTLNFVDGTSGTVTVNFTQPSKGWYTAAEENGANYCGSTYRGTVGEEKTLYYFYGMSTGKELVSLTAQIDGSGDDVTKIEAGESKTVGAFTVNAQNSDFGYVMVTGTVPMNQKTLVLILTLENTSTVKANLTFRSSGNSGSSSVGSSGGWYDAPNKLSENFLSNSKFFIWHGMPGEEKVFYYFFPEGVKPEKVSAYPRYGSGIAKTEIKLKENTLYRQWEIDMSQLEEGYFSVSGIVTEDRSIQNDLKLDVDWSNGRSDTFTCGWWSKITDYDSSQSEPTLTENGVTYTFAPGHQAGQTLQFAGFGGVRHESWRTSETEYYTWEYFVGAYEKVGGSERISATFDQYITDVTCEIDKNTSGELMYHNQTSQDPDALKIEVFKAEDKSDPHPWKLNVSILKEHYLSARLLVTIKVKMPGWEKEQAYTYILCWIASNPYKRQGQDYVFDASEYNTSKKLNAILSDVDSLLAAFRESDYDEYSKWLAAEPQGYNDVRNIIVKLSPNHYDDVICAKIKSNLKGVSYTLQGSEKNGKRTVLPGLILDGAHNVDIIGIHFIAQTGKTVTRGEETFTCAILALEDMRFNISNCLISGFDVGIHAVAMKLTECRLENNKIGWLSKADGYNTEAGLFIPMINNASFEGNDTAIKVELLPEGASAVKMWVNENNFIDNVCDMDMANGELGTLFYAYQNYFGHTVNGTLVPRTALVELGKATTVVTNPRRWAPVGSGDNRLFIDILYPGVTWIINSQTEDLKISEDLISTEEDTELTVTDEEGKKVGKWKFEGGKKKK